MSNIYYKPIDEWITRVADGDFPNMGTWAWQEANWACHVLGKPLRYNPNSPVDLQFYIDMQDACIKYLKESGIE